MVFNNSKMITIQSPKLHFFHLLSNLMSLCVFFLFFPCATPLAFNFPSFPNGVNTISIEGDAHIEGQFLRLTKSSADESLAVSVGRATYTKPFLLREKSSGKLADFTSNFSFIIDAQNENRYADGLALFLAPQGTLLNKSIGVGSSLGLPVNNTYQLDNPTTTQHAFVAVEFDIHLNEYPPVDDPSFQHVGINVNSMLSIDYENWNGGIADGRENSVWISYESSTTNLSIAFTTYVNGTQEMGYLYYPVDLKQYLPDSVIVGFSAATGVEIALHKILSWNFTSTSFVNVPEPGPSAAPSPSKASPGMPHRNSNVGLEVVLISVGGCIIVVGMLCMAWFIWWKLRKGGEGDEDPTVDELMDKELQKGIGPRKFYYKELAQATGNFVEGGKLGEGGFGDVYKGFIKNLNSYVAIKRISKRSKQGLKEYASEVRIISRLRHRNIVQLIGWCHDKRDLLLVYEFMPNQSLDFHLFKAKSLLTWELRYKIAQGLASGLLYPHEGWEQCVLHRDIKPSNIMLDSNFTAKLGDFGLARLVDHGKQSHTTMLAGTMGYIAPEFITTGKASKGFDIYSFGVVALEIACGRKPIDSKFENSEISMVEWVWELYVEGKILEAADPRLCGEFDEKQMECLLTVGLWCAHLNYNVRPSIQQVIQVLNFKVPLPIVPPNMSISTHFAPPASLQLFMTNDTTGFVSRKTTSTC